MWLSVITNNIRNSKLTNNNVGNEFCTRMSQFWKIIGGHEE